MLIHRRSLEDLLGEIKKSPYPLDLHPTAILVTPGRIVRVTALAWWYMMPGPKRWMTLGPFWTQRGARQAAQEASFTIAEPWIHYRDLEQLFGPIPLM